MLKNWKLAALCLISCSGLLASAWISPFVSTPFRQWTATRASYHYFKQQSLLFMVDYSLDKESNEKILQEKGNEIIRKAALQAGASTDEIVSIEWKQDKIIVTVDLAVDGIDILEGMNDDEIDRDELAEMEWEDDDFEEDERQEDAGVTSVARAIIAALDEGGEGSVGWDIATRYELEVTTPGFDGVLTEPRMFDAYKGFDVICEYQDPKKKKDTSIEGKLVERNDKVTAINVKGRIRKIKNELIHRVRLPKAKKEKGVR